MATHNFTICSEWKLLEILCLGLRNPYEQEIFKALMKSSDLNWGTLLEQALRHKILPMLAFHTTFSEVGENVPPFIKRHLWTLLFLNIHKTNLMREQAAKVVKALNKQEIQFVGTKGITLESKIYESNGIRYLADIDFMFIPKYRDLVIHIMSDLGYKMGKFNWKTGSLRSHSREIIASYKLNPDHLPHFILLTNDPVVPYILVDFANSLTWTRSPFTVPIEAALAEIIYQPIPGIPDIQMPCFNPKFQFIFTILHLFREAWVFREGWSEELLSWETDVTLSKFADVIRLWRIYQKELNTPDFIQTLEEFQIIDPILWVLEHTDRTFHTGIVPALGLEGRVTEEWLHSAGGVGGKRVQWKGTMRERLYCKDRRQLFITDT